MTTHTSSEPQDETPTVPCPNCGGTTFHRVGKFRSQCTGCNSTVANSTLGIPDQDPQ